MAGLSRSPRFSSSALQPASRARPTLSARTPVAPALRQPVRFNASCTRAATSMIVAGTIAIATGMGGLIWVGMQILAHYPT